MDEAKGISLNHLYALALLEFGEARGLADVYEQIWLLMSDKSMQIGNVENSELRAAMDLLPPDDLVAILREFLTLAHDRLASVPVEIISAMPLSEEQIMKLHVKLANLVHKQLEITNTTDESLLGGFRILFENTVIDHSVKRKLMDARQAIYEGVYYSDGRAPQ